MTVLEQQSHWDYTKMTLNTEILGWIGNVFFVIGCFLIAKQNVKGLILNSVGNFMYLLQSLLMYNISLVILSIFLGIINAYGIYIWRKNGK